MEVVNTIDSIRKLLNEKVSHNIEGIDLLLFLLLDVIAFELKKSNSITDKTGGALIQITSFQSIEYYYHKGYLELDTELKKLAYLLRNYNEKLLNLEVDLIGTKPENWCNYFKERIEFFLNNFEE